MPVLDTTQTTANGKCLCYNSSSVSLISATDLANCSFNSKHTYLTIATLPYMAQLFSPLKITQFHQSSKKADKNFLHSKYKTRTAAERKKRQMGWSQGNVRSYSSWKYQSNQKKVAKMSSERSSL